MAKQSDSTAGTPEIDAIKDVFQALRNLDLPAQMRVLRYAAEMLGLSLPSSTSGGAAEHEERPLPPVATPPVPASNAGQALDSDIDGINSVALRWMSRSDLSPKRLQSLFSLGIDVIDLVAKSVPGANKKDRMHSVILLKCIAAYLGTGAARVSFEELKEACLHYNAYDGSNFATYLRSFAAEIGGTKEAGFTLTARGLNAATELIKTILGAEPKNSKS